MVDDNSNVIPSKKMLSFNKDNINIESHRLQDYWLKIKIYIIRPKIIK